MASKTDLTSTTELEKVCGDGQSVSEGTPKSAEAATIADSAPNEQFALESQPKQCPAHQRLRAIEDAEADMLHSNGACRAKNEE